MTIRTCIPADPRDQGRVGGDGADRQGRPGARPTSTCWRSTGRSRELETACRDFCERGQHTDPPRDPAPAGRAAGRGTAAAAPAAQGSRSPRVRHHPPGELGLHDLGRGRALLGPAPAGRHPGLGPLPRRRTDRHRRRRRRHRVRGRPPPPRHARAHRSSSRAHYPPREDKDADRDPEGRPRAEEAAFLDARARAPQPGWSRPPPPGTRRIKAEDGRGRRPVQAALAGRGRPGPGHRRGHRPVRRERPDVDPRLPGRPRPTPSPPGRSEDPQPAARHLRLVRASAPPPAADDSNDERTASDGHPAAHRPRHQRRPARRGDRAHPPPEAAPHPPGADRPDPHRQGPALGPRRGRPRPARRGSRRPRPRQPAHPPQAGRLPRRQDLRRLGRDQHPPSPRRPRTPSRAWNGSAAGRIFASAARRARASRTSARPSARPRSRPG